MNETDLPAIVAGFPSPAEDYVEPEIDPVKLLIKNSSTFCSRAKCCYDDVGISTGDIVVIDRSLNCKEGMAACILEGQFTIKRFKRERGMVWILPPKDTDYEPIILQEGDDFMVWGIVTYIIKKV